MKDTPIHSSNLLKKIPKSLKEEVFENILLNDKFKLERIISKGHITPQGEWYDQDQNEWVMILKGNADLKIEGKIDLLKLVEGDSILLPAHVKHRVERTDESQETIWLALHF